MLSHCGTVDIETPRLLLRRLRMEDAAAVHRNWGADEEVFFYMTTDIMKTLPEVRRFLQKKQRLYEQKDYYYWAVVPRAGEGRGEPVGMVTFTDVSERGRSANLAYTLGRRWWGRGYAREASVHAMELMFRRVGLETVTGSHFEGNGRSGRTLLSLGMRPLGKSAELYRFNGGFRHCFDYSITAREFFEKIAEKDG